MADIKSFVWSMVVLVLIIVAVWFGGRFSVLQDHFSIYDDFSGSLRTDLWSFSAWPYDNNFGRYTGTPMLLNTVGDGLLHVGSGTVDGGWTGGAIGDRPVLPIVESTKQFSSEDIKIYVSSSSYTAGYCGSGYKFGGAFVCYGGDCINPTETGRATNNKGCWTYSTTSPQMIEIKRYDDLDLKKYVWIINGKEHHTGLQESATVSFKGLMHVDYVKYQPYFSCEIDYNTEVVVRDKFVVGSDIDIDSLTYTPLKFCPQDLGALIFSDKGLTDEKGSLTEALAQGKKILIRSDCTGLNTDDVKCVEAAILQFDYITKYVTDMKEKCGVGEVYDTKAKSCVQIAGQQVSDKSLLICNSENDCIIPNNCPGTVAECKESQCEYVSDSCTKEQLINNILVQKTLNLDKPTIEKINDGSVLASFNAPKTVLGVPFTIESIRPLSAKPQCQVSDGYLSPTKEGCYAVAFEWGEYKFTIENGASKELDDNFNVQFDMGGRGVFNGDHGDKIYNYEFVGSADDYQIQIKLTMKNLMSFSVSEYKERAVLNNDYSIKLNVDNNIFTVFDSGYNIKVKKDIRTVEDSMIVKASFRNGPAIYSIDLPTDELGIYQAEIIPYMQVFDNLVYSGDKLDISYYVEETQSSCRQTGCAIGECTSDGSCKVLNTNIDTASKPTQTTDVSIWLTFLIFIGVVFVIILVVIVARKK
jgi:hypothetical protein